MDALAGIIGAGPAGISTAVQLRRYDLDSIVFERSDIGGLVRNAYLIENSMFFPGGIRGKDFVNLLREYVRKYGLRIIHAYVKKVVKNGNFRIMTDGREYEFKYLVVASGTCPRRLPYDGVKYHITEIDGFRDEILIVGGGDIALDYALSMSERARRVTVLYRSRIRALPALVRYVRKRGNIVLKKGEIRGIINKGDKKRVLTTAGGLEVDEVLAAIGRIPNIDIVKGIEDKRLFIIGDAKNAPYRQTTMAIGDGIKAAMDIWRCENEDTCGDRQ
ncbi:MAG TPA: NAD(P)/FAD-dependent oxidoreductase [Thermoplasmatales archaeon]|nr:NAD(P)/FAD-dependent oxidoreductase [Thermoplasmatales archaeon]